MRLPESALAPKNDGFVLGLNMDARVIHNLQDPSRSYIQITNVEGARWDALSGKCCGGFYRPFACTPNKSESVKVVNLIIEILEHQNGKKWYG